MSDGLEQVGIEALEYSPLRSNRKSLQSLDELLPAFQEMEADLKRLRIALGNGDIKWQRPLDLQPEGA